MKPNFRDGWRRPKGLHSKVRLSKRGNVGLFSIGMSKREGNKKKIKLAHNIKELKNNKELIIAKVGLKKKIELLKEAEKSGINILNIKDPKKFLKKNEEELKKKKEQKKEKKERKKKEKKEKKEEKTKEKLDEKLKKEEEKVEKKEEEERKESVEK